MAEAPQYDLIDFIKKALRLTSKGPIVDFHPKRRSSG
jgi:hypothetical protein